MREKLDEFLGRDRCYWSYQSYGNYLNCSNNSNNSDNSDNSDCSDNSDNSCCLAESKKIANFADIA